MIALHPGFPLTHADYGPLLSALPGRSTLTIAHSLGALDALREAAGDSEGSASPAREPGRTIVLLAPSTPRIRPLRPALRSLLRGAARGPLARPLAERMRAGTFARYGAEAPPGLALPLAEAAERLRAPRWAAVPTSSTRVVVVCAVDDARHPAQQRFAEALGAELRWARGGHLFPISHPEATAALLADLG